MPTTDFESKKTKITRWKLNTIIFISVINMIGLTTLIGSLNQVNKNITNVSTVCNMSQAIYELTHSPQQDISKGK